MQSQDTHIGMLGEKIVVADYTSASLVGNMVAGWHATLWGSINCMLVASWVAMWQACIVSEHPLSEQLLTPNASSKT
eukprot:3964873-Prorocentrum_lima.AAC.1